MPMTLDQLHRALRDVPHNEYKTVAVNFLQQARKIDPQTDEYAERIHLAEYNYHIAANLGKLDVLDSLRAIVHKEPPPMLSV